MIMTTERDRRLRLLRRCRAPERIARSRAVRSAVNVVTAPAFRGTLSGPRRSRLGGTFGSRTGPRDYRSVPRHPPRRLVRGKIGNSRLGPAGLALRPPGGFESPIADR